MALSSRLRTRRGSSSHLSQPIRRCAAYAKLAVGTGGKVAATVDHSDEVENALARVEGLKLTVPPGFKELHDVVSAICVQSALSKAAAVERLHEWLRSGEIVSLGVPVIFGTLAIALNPDPRHRAIPRDEWRDMELEYRSKRLSGWVAKGIYRPGVTSIGAMGTLIEMERTRPRYSRLMVEERVIERLVREFPTQSSEHLEKPPFAPKRKRKLSKPEMVAELLKQQPHLGSGTNLAIREALTRELRAQRIFTIKEGVSATTLLRAKKLIP